MSIFQIAATLFALFMIYVVSIHRRHILNRIEVFCWYSLWVLFIIFALFPNLLLGITDTLHFSRVFDLLLVGALMVLTVIIVMSYFAQKENTRKIEEVVRKMALDKPEQNQDG